MATVSVSWGAAARAVWRGPSGWLLRALATLYELGAFTVITLGVMLTKFRRAPALIRPMIREQVWLAGVRLLPMVVFLGLVLGLVVVGQTVALLTRVGAHDFIGTVMVVVVMRELGPLLAALLVLARSGTATAVELGTVRALGEVEALESLGVDPVHYLVVPRVVGLAVATFCLTTYLVLVTVLSGWVFAFLQDVPLTPGEYFQQLNGALRVEDFVLLMLKSAAFGIVIAVVSCYQGLARPLHVEEVSRVTTRAVIEGVVGCVVVDAIFLLGYLLL
ncbi:MAG: ABC transporter permease [Verrucomicrobiae bacterium]|nr:ABC transporter permease [Verrucomicrobiae bacterium]MDW8343980.1 ABC transporter permease [Verrucomicrobiae bacterium]